VLWIGLVPHPYLRHLAAGIHEAVLACGIPQDERPFSPHITLARLKPSPSRTFDAFLDQNRNLKLPPCSVRKFTLFQSRLTPQGAVHTPLRSFPLAAA
jgi:2'-5' RNA ligase